MHTPYSTYRPVPTQTTTLDPNPRFRLSNTYLEIEIVDLRSTIPNHDLDHGQQGTFVVNNYVAKREMRNKLHMYIPGPIYLPPLIRN